MTCCTARLKLSMSSPSSTSTDWLGFTWTWRTRIRGYHTSICTSGTMCRQCSGQCYEHIANSDQIEKTFHSFFDSIRYAWTMLLIMILRYNMFFYLNNCSVSQICLDNITNYDAETQHIFDINNCSLSQICLDNIANSETQEFIKYNKPFYRQFSPICLGDIAYDTMALQH